MTQSTDQLQMCMGFPQTPIYYPDPLIAHFGPKQHFAYVAMYSLLPGSVCMKSIYYMFQIVC